jgi:hypothetical protein
MGISMVLGMFTSSSCHNMLSLLVTIATTSNTIATIKGPTQITHVASIDAMGHSPSNSLGNTI